MVVVGFVWIIVEKFKNSRIEELKRTDNCLQLSVLYYIIKKEKGESTYEKYRKKNFIFNSFILDNWSNSYRISVLKD